MPLVIVALAVVLLLVMMTRYKINGFIALFVAALFVGVARGMALPKIYDAIVSGVGDQLDELILILGFGAMLGKVLADSGAAQRIATSVVNVFGIGRVQLAMVLTATCIGITMFYEVGFVLLIPLVFTIVREYRLPLLWVGLPMSMTLSTMHSFLPPHPGPAAVTETFHASQGVTLLYGLPIAIVSAALVCFVWPRLAYVKRINPSLPVSLITEREFDEEDLPGFGTCMAIVITPIALMAASAVAELSLGEDDKVREYLEFFGEAPIALLIALLLAVVLLGPKIAQTTTTDAGSTPAAGGSPRTGNGDDSPKPGDGGTAAAPKPGDGGTAAAPKPGDGGTVTAPRSSVAAATRNRFEAAMASCNEAIKPIAMIIMVIGAGGAFKEVLVKSGIADYIADFTHGWNVSPLLLAWGIAALVRVAVGSASVAVVTAAGIVLPLVQNSGTSPELMVLAVTCGSIALSHVNDPGFWLFKQYLNLSVLDTIKIRTGYTTALAVLGLGGVLLMNVAVG
ncbi:gluconate permease [Actinomadura barringtoniae]|uniref:Gluconate permease n=1 Tax=Actinomadura barringtoniae TaxID=1427535 RepID=A0A939P685_9ACTN|nr:SLC13 family permease [Actinomadura barringtoniae]MBO2446068.1 gluconate permease [Actinomadura barringtoniae]